jgi:hypothetical protein
VEQILRKCERHDDEIRSLNAKRRIAWKTTPLNATSSLEQADTSNEFRMDATLRFWIDCSSEDRRYEHPKRTRTQRIAEILRDYERAGDAMRYLNANGQITWKASPSMLQRLADAEREVTDDMEGMCDACGPD